MDQKKAGCEHDRVCFGLPPWPGYCRSAMKVFFFGGGFLRQHLVLAGRARQLSNNRESCKPVVGLPPTQLPHETLAAPKPLPVYVYEIASSAPPDPLPGEYIASFKPPSEARGFVHHGASWQSDMAPPPRSSPTALWCPPAPTKIRTTEKDSHHLLPRPLGMWILKPGLGRFGKEAVGARLRAPRAVPDIYEARRLRVAMHPSPRP